MERILEPELMDDEGQALAYAQADFVEVNRGFVDRFRTAFPDLTRSRVVDLGCGPADIPIRLVRLMPALGVTAVDASAAMVRLAREAVHTAGLATSVRLVRARLPALPFASGTFDAVIANSLLHHVAEPGIFWREVQRLGRARAGVLVMDVCPSVGQSACFSDALTYRFRLRPITIAATVAIAVCMARSSPSRPSVAALLSLRDDLEGRSLDTQPVLVGDEADDDPVGDLEGTAFAVRARSPQDDAEVF